MWLTIHVKIIKIAFPQPILACLHRIVPPKNCAAGVVMLALRVKKPVRMDISYMAWKILHPNSSMRIKTSYLPQGSGSHFSCPVEQLNCFPFFSGTEGKGPCSNAQKAWIALFINCHVLAKHRSGNGKSENAARSA